jgi:MEMO1 family protein
MIHCHSACDSAKGGTRVDDERIPALRAVELVPVQHEGRELILLRDPQGIAAEPLLLSPASLTLLQLFDGDHTLRDAQAAITGVTGRIVPGDEIRAFVAHLDRLGYLDSLTFLERRRELSLAYTSSPVRAARFAGLAYAADAGRLNAELDALYQTADAPGLPDAAVSSPPAGLAAPHIDPARGGAVYAHAYRHLWGAAPRTVVVLGIAHGGTTQPFITTAKDYATPLGTARTHRELLADLAGRLAWDPFEGEVAHAAEHSIEFQIVFAQHAFSRGGRDAVPEPRFVPILCGFNASDLEPDAIAPRARIDAFLETLREALAEAAAPVLVIAGVDLTHAGRRFGDPFSLGDAVQAKLRDRDLATLELVARGARDEFVAESVRERDARRMCGFPALYSLLTLLPQMRGRVAGYGQSVDAEQNGLVSYAALLLEDCGSKIGVGQEASHLPLAH